MGWEKNIAGDVELVIPQWDDMRVPVTSTTRLGSKDPDLVQVFDNGAGSQGVISLAFSNLSEEEVYFTAQLPHSYKEGTDIDAHVHWLVKTAGADGAVVNWGLEYTWANVGGSFSDTTIVSNNEHMPPDTSIIADKHYLTEITKIDGTGQTVSSMLICRLFRDATGTLGTDDYSNDAVLLEIDFHYQIDTMGSKQEYTK